MSERQRAGRRIVGPFALGLSIACCILTLGMAILADPIATAIARARLEGHGIVCDERFALDVSWAMDVATIAPSACTAREGGVESFELLDPVHVELGAGMGVRSVRGGRARIVPRFDPPPVQALGLGPELDPLGIPARLGILVAASSRLASSDLPRIEMGAIEIGPAERPSAALAGVHIVGRTSGEPLAMRIDRADLPPISGPIGVRSAIVIAPLSIEATPSRARIEGELAIDAAVPIIGSMQHETHLVLTGEDLDGPHPRFEVHR